MSPTEKDEPVKKRARFADEDGQAMEDVLVEDAEESGDDEEEEEEEEEEELPPYTVIANDVMTVKLVTGANDDAEGRSFNPTYTHQVFRVKASEDAEATHEEYIIGYENPTIDIYYASNSLKAFVDFKSDATVDMKLLKQNHLTRTNVYNCINKYAPADYAIKLADVIVEAYADFKPMGKLVNSDIQPGGETLETYHFVADTPEACQFVARMQTFVIWTIETGSVIQVPDPAWNIYTLYEKCESGGKAVYCLLGFVTAYRYWVYDKFSHSVDKARTRISQVVVLPPFQRKGHGARLLRSVYKAAREDPRVLDVSVEDPSPDFQAMRDVADAMMMRESGDWSKMSADKPPIKELALKYKITCAQMSRLAVVAQFVALGLTDPEGDPEAVGGAAKALRLRLKQKFYKQSLCEPRGLGLVEDLGTDTGDKGKGAKKSAAAREEEEKSAAEEEAEKLVKVWGEGGDPDTRKDQLRGMYKAMYMTHARTAAKIVKT